MARKKISQADARQYRKERDEAQQKLNMLLDREQSQYGGTDLGGLVNVNGITMANLRTARRLKFALFVVPSDAADSLDFRAIRPGEF